MPAGSDTASRTSSRRCRAGPPFDCNSTSADSTSAQQVRALLRESSRNGLPTAPSVYPAHGSAHLSWTCGSAVIQTNNDAHSKLQAPAIESQRMSYRNVSSTQLRNQLDYGFKDAGRDALWPILQISAFWNAQAQAYLQPGSAGWIMWSLKMENGGIWSLEACYNGVSAATRAARIAAVPRSPPPQAPDASDRRAACGLSAVASTGQASSTPYIACRNTHGAPMLTPELLMFVRGSVGGSVPPLSPLGGSHTALSLCSAPLSGWAWACRWHAYKAIRHPSSRVRCCVCRGIWRTLHCRSRRPPPHHHRSSAASTAGSRAASSCTCLSCATAERAHKAFRAAASAQRAKSRVSPSWEL